MLHTIAETPHNLLPIKIKFPFINSVELKRMVWAQMNGKKMLDVVYIRGRFDVRRMARTRNRVILSAVQIFWDRYQFNLTISATNLETKFMASGSAQNMQFTKASLFSSSTSAVRNLLKLRRSEQMTTDTSDPMVTRATNGNILNLTQKVMKSCVRVVNHKNDVHQRHSKLQPPFGGKNMRKRKEKKCHGKRNEPFSKFDFTDSKIMRFIDSSSWSKIKSQGSKSKSRFQWRATGT